MRLAVALTALGVCLLTGCSLSPTAAPDTTIGAHLSGNVHGGQQPIVGAHIYLFAANTSGYGQPSISLLSTSSNPSLATDSVGTYVTTDAQGDFSITADYTCTGSTQVYVYALGGNPGAGTNPSAGLLSALGPCPSTSSFIWINEVTTVAAAYALSGFATDATHISSSGTPQGLLGIQNAFANAANLVNSSTGVALAVTPAGNGIAPQARLDTLANILASCVNSTGANTGPTNPTACYTLFHSATSDSTSTGTQPTDTATAAINIAHFPASNISALYGLASPTTAFAPALPSKPADFTVPLFFTGSRTGAGSTNGTGEVLSMVVDGLGNVFSIAGTGATTISRLSPLGADLSTPNTFVGNSTDAPIFLAIDASNNVWALNFVVGHPLDNTYVSEYSAAGALISGTGYSGGNVSSTSSFQACCLAFNSSGNLAAETNNTFTLFTPSGTLVTPQPAYPSSSQGPDSEPFAFDTSGDLWYPSRAQNGLAETLPSGATATGSPFTGGGAQSGFAVAIDHTGNIWMDNGNSNISITSSTGAAVSPSPIANPGAGQPQGLILDGNGGAYAFETTTVPSQISRILTSAGALTSSIAVGTDYLNTISGSLAIDPSGNLWTADFNETTYPNIPPQRIVELVGFTAPVVTPLAAAVKNNTLATRP